MVSALARERAVIGGEAVDSGAALRLCDEVANHLRALLRDVICGHLDEDLAALADEILLEAREAAAEGAARRAGDAGQDDPDADLVEEEYSQLSVQEMLGEAGEPEEVLDLSV